MADCASCYYWKTVYGIASSSTVHPHKPESRHTVSANRMLRLWLVRIQLSKPWGILGSVPSQNLQSIVTIKTFTLGLLYCIDYNKTGLCH